MDSNKRVKAPGRTAQDFLGGSVSPDDSTFKENGRGKLAPKRTAPSTEGESGRKFGPDTGRGRVAALRAPDGDTVKRLLQPNNGSSESNQIRFAAPGPIKESSIALAPKRKLAIKLPANF